MKIDFIICPACKHNQKQDTKHPQTFRCDECGNHFNYKVNVSGKYEVIKKGRTPLPPGNKKKGVQVREYEYILKRMRAAGYSDQQVWSAGILAIDSLK